MAGWHGKLVSSGSLRDPVSKGKGKYPLLDSHTHTWHTYTRVFVDRHTDKK